jgi:hypothetical protein
MRLKSHAVAYFSIPILLALFSLVGIVQASDCKIVNTQLDGSSFICGESPIGICADGTITSGILKGTKLAVYTAGAPGAGLFTESPVVASYSANAVFTTKHGELHLSQLGVTDPINQIFTELNRVVGGTGRFLGATGELFISGTLNTPELVTGFESRVTGTVCIN